MIGVLNQVSDLEIAVALPKGSLIGDRIVVSELPHDLPKFFLISAVGEEHSSFVSEGRSREILVGERVLEPLDESLPRVFKNIVGSWFALLVDHDVNDRKISIRASWSAKRRRISRRWYFGIRASSPGLVSICPA